MYVTILDFWKAPFLLLAYLLCKSPSFLKRRLAWWQIVVRQCVWSSGQNSTLSGRGKVAAITLTANLQTVSLLFATICYLLGDNRVWLPTVRTGAGRRSGQTLTLFRCIVWHIAIYSHWRSCCLAYCNVLSLAILLSSILQCIVTGDPAVWHIAMYSHWRSCEVKRVFLMLTSKLAFWSFWCLVPCHSGGNSGFRIILMFALIF